MDYTAADLERIDAHAAQRLHHEEFLRRKPEYSDGSAELRRVCGPVNLGGMQVSAYRVTVRTSAGLSLEPVEQYAETNRAACRQVLASLPSGWMASARIEDQTSYVRDPLAVRMSGLSPLGDAA